MLGMAELPIAILAWFFVIVISVTALGSLAYFIWDIAEKRSFEAERKRRDNIRRPAKIVAVNKGESRNEEVQS